MKRLLRLILIMAIAAIVLFGSRWYTYVTNTESPYQEVGIDINSRLPDPFNKWGCAKLQANFSTMLPPYGCQNPTDPKQWR
ncbi:hypothetical protein HGO34_08195 [Agrobacterium vitis]|uniref:Uncharacterized protein n=1 Tax=Agrobacterium vitis TaxID=373 RepID=A0AAE4WBI6_AGRVI|nr:hypothetical protein [Agrobacterium vitis]MCF1496620.1 hypothetical protein [Allorhizobium sp. Av2]MCM2439695.1 hypothetical protein [Agrobacterium vitis]MUZ57408.1 hypothetical protein [Agrobacterium vitis]MVA69084.1 hypothetical protein [Agrobacterium vitis]MVA86742.1 hypothetical protein [Agrobacterium vitis]